MHECPNKEILGNVNGCEAFKKWYDSVDTKASEDEKELGRDYGLGDC